MKPRARLQFLGLSLAALAWGVHVLACGQEEPVELRSVPAPGAAELPRSVRDQLNDQYARLQGLVGAGNADRDTLGAAFGRMGELSLAYGLTQPAEPALLNALVLCPEETRWPYYLGFLYKSTGRPEEAVRYLRRVLEMDAGNNPARIHLAEALVELGRDEEAKDLLEAVVRRDPEHAGAHFLLGLIAASSGDPVQAVDHYETVLRLQPGASVVNYPLGLAYRQAGERARSREHLSRRGSGQIEVRDSLLDRLQDLKVGPEADLLRGTRLMNQGRNREALLAFARAVREDSTSVAGHLNLGVLYARLGMSEQAIAEFGTVIRLEPSNSQAQHYLGRLLLDRGDSLAALEHYRLAVQADPRNSDARLTLANLLWLQRRCRDAVAHFAAHLAANPETVSARIKQAICHVQLGQHVQALRILEDGLDAYPERPELLDAAVRVLAASPDASVRDGERAVDLAERLVDRVRVPQTLESLAMAYAETGRYGEAVRLQSEVVRRLARRDAPPRVLDHMRTRLDRYQDGLPCRLPWPPTVFATR